MPALPDSVFPGSASVPPAGHGLERTLQQGFLSGTL